MLHLPAGESHRWISEDMKGITISTSAGGLLKTEARTRSLTDTWKNNLLMQKKPNDDGIQCHDPLLNKHIVVWKAPEYNHHIKILGNPQNTPSCSEHPKFRNKQTSQNDRKEIIVYGMNASENAHDDKQLLIAPTETPKPPVTDVHKGSQDLLVDKFTGRESPTSSCMQEELQKMKDSGDLEPLPLATADTHKPRPLSPGAVAQKLRRYKIGSSPKQKVRNMLDDLVHYAGTRNADSSPRKDVGRGHSLVRVNPVGVLAAGVTKGGTAARHSLEGTLNVFLNDQSLWDETVEHVTHPQEATSPQNFQVLLPGGGNTELSESDYLYLHKQGLFRTDSSSNHESFKDESSIFSKDLDDGGKGGSRERNASHLSSGTSADTLSAIDVSPMLDRSTNAILSRQQNTSLRGGESDGDSDSVLSLQTFASKKHAQYLIDFNVRKNRGWRTKSQSNFDAESVKAAAINSHRVSQHWKVYKKHGDYDYQSGEESSRGSFSEDPTTYVANPEHPICHNCVKPGRLWCNICAKVFCYNCWGLVEHHEPRHATEVLAADVLPQETSEMHTIGSLPELLAPFHGKQSLAQSLPVLGNNMEISLDTSAEQKDQGSNIQISLPTPSAKIESFSMSQSSLTEGPSIQMGSKLLSGGSQDDNCIQQQQSRPMTDRIGSDCGSEPDEQMSKASGFYIRHDKQPHNDHSKVVQVSNLSSDRHYFRQVTTPFVPPGSQKQSRMTDQYVEYDELNAEHFSPAKKNPQKVQALQTHYDEIMAVTSERNRGYADQIFGSISRRKKVAQKINDTLHGRITKKYPTLRREQGKRQITRIEAARLDGRAEPKVVQGVGKLIPERNLDPIDLSIQGSVVGVAASNNIVRRQLGIREVKELHPVLLFENSPLNKELHIPEKNADGSAIRIPPNPHEKFMLEKAHRRRKELRKNVATKDSIYSKKSGELRERSHPLDSTFSHVEAKKLYGGDENVFPVCPVVDEAMLHEKGLEAEHVGKSCTSSEDFEEQDFVERMREGWGFHPMRAKSSREGNVPSLPFLGPPFLVDMKTEEHFNTPIRPFSEINAHERACITPGRNPITPYAKGQTPIKEKVSSLWGVFKKTEGSLFDPNDSEVS